MKKSNKFKSLFLFLTTLFLFISCSSSNDNLKGFYDQILTAEQDGTCRITITKERMDLWHKTEKIGVLFYTKKGDTLISDPSNSGVHIALSIDKKMNKLTVIDTNIVPFEDLVFSYKVY